MNNSIKVALAFVMGATTGVLASMKFFKDKYKKFADEEIASVKEKFTFKKPDGAVEEDLKQHEKAPVEEKHEDQVKVADMKDVIQKNDYTTYSKPTVPDSIANADELYCTETDPYVITPDEFGEIHEYDTISLTYYSDGKLADDNDELVDDVESTVGNDSLTRFGEYEADSVFVRNNRLKADFEILKDRRSYAEVAGE